MEKKAINDHVSRFVKAKNKNKLLNFDNNNKLCL